MSIRPRWWFESAVLKKPTAQLDADLKRTGDPRATGRARFDTYRYSGGGPKFPRKKTPRTKKK